MAKEIVPHKLVVTYNEDGTVHSALLQYRVRVDGKVGRQFETMTVTDGVKDKSGSMDGLMRAGIIHAEVGEKIRTRQSANGALSSMGVMDV